MQKNILLVLLMLMCWIITACQQERIDKPDNQTRSSKPQLKWIGEQDLKKINRSPAQGVIYMPTPPMVVDKMLELAQVNKNDLVYDLGCGDGRIVIAAARKYGCKAVGFEIEKEMVEKARENVKKHKVEHLVRIEQRDIFQVDLDPADVIMLYLTPELNERLIPQLEKLKAGSRIVSHDFDIKGIKPHVAINFTSKEPDFVNIHMIYLWTAPLKKE